MNRVAFTLSVCMVLIASCAPPATLAPVPATVAADAPTSQSVAVDTPQDASAPMGLTLTNDYTPDTGKQAGAPPESPGEFRLLTAISNDGVTFERTGQVVLDQANVPDLVWGDNGLIHLYYQAAKVGDRPNSIGMAISPDLGQTWYFKETSFEGLAGNVPTPADPDIVRLDDGTFRLYATTNIGKQKLGIIRMDSSDGVHFGASSVAFSLDTNVIDSTTFYFNGLWHMLVLDTTRPEQWYATSPDGLTFTLVNKPSFDNHILANGYAIDTGYRLIGFPPPGKGFRAFDSSDGTNWTAQPGEAFPFDASSSLEGNQIKDPSILPLPDGRYLMVYVTRIP